MGSIKNKCNVCNGEVECFDRHIILNKYDVQYYKCKNCGTIQTEEPYWLEEAYREVINDSDIGMVSRNIENSKIVSAILKSFFDTSASYLDYAGGYGLFVRLMRNEGFDFEWYDKYCQNMFAKHFEKSKKEYDVVTAFEFMEHISNPITYLNSIFETTNSFLFSTYLIPAPCPKITEWWYYNPEEGQHITFYTENAFNIIANNYGKNYLHYLSFHLITDKEISKEKFEHVINEYQKVNEGMRLESLLQEDYKKITNKNLV